jgi:hypothetical protein
VHLSTAVTFSDVRKEVHFEVTVLTINSKLLVTLFYCSYFESVQQNVSVSGTAGTKLCQDHINVDSQSNDWFVVDSAKYELPLYTKAKQLLNTFQ